MIKLTDNDLMPYGKHKGKQLKDIPPAYFKWLNDQIKSKSKIHWNLTDKLLNEYINENVN